MPNHQNRMLPTARSVTFPDRPACRQAMKAARSMLRDPKRLTRWCLLAGRDNTKNDVDLLSSDGHRAMRITIPAKRHTRGPLELPLPIEIMRALATMPAAGKPPTLLLGYEPHAHRTQLVARLTHTATSEDDVHPCYNIGAVASLDRVLRPPTTTTASGIRHAAAMAAVQALKGSDVCALEALRGTGLRLWRTAAPGAADTPDAVIPCKVTGGPRSTTIRLTYRYLADTMRDAKGPTLTVRTNGPLETIHISNETTHSFVIMPVS